MGCLYPLEKSHVRDSGCLFAGVIPHPLLWCFDFNCVSRLLHLYQWGVPGWAHVAILLLFLYLNIIVKQLSIKQLVLEVVATEKLNQAISITICPEATSKHIIQSEGICAEGTTASLW